MGFWDQFSTIPDQFSTIPGQFRQAFGPFVPSLETVKDWVPGPRLPTEPPSVMNPAQPGSPPAFTPTGSAGDHGFPGRMPTFNQSPPDPLASMPGAAMPASGSELNPTTGYPPSQTMPGEAPTPSQTFSGGSGNTFNVWRGPGGNVQYIGGPGGASLNNPT